MDAEQVARAIDHAVKELFPAGAVVRAELLRHGDDPAIGPAQLMVRVVVPGRGSADVLAAWAATHRRQMDELRREVSLRLPAGRPGSSGPTPTHRAAATSTGRYTC